MNQIKGFGVVIVVFLFSLVACKSDKPQSQLPLSKPVNIIVVLDVSDRLFKEKLPGQERQAEKDIKIAEGIINVFEGHVRRARYIHSRHRIAFAVPPQPGTDPPIPQETLEALKIWPINQDRMRGAPRFQEMKDALLKAIRDLYLFVEERQQFTGSDIWGWFKVSAEAYLHPDALNYIICISDGYLYLNSNLVDQLPKVGNKTTVIRHTLVEEFSKDPNWEAKFGSEGHGLLSIEKDFTRYNAKFLMVEVGLKELKVKDLPILEKYWKPWLEAMGINNAEFLHTQDDPAIVIEKVKAFISPQKSLAPQ